jgi:acyl carrier protein
MREKIREYIKTELIRDPGYDLQDDEPIITGGLIDSFSLVLLQTYIQEEFGVLIDDADMTVETADNLNDIIGLIEKSR